MVSSLPKRACVMLVASSTMSIRQPPRTTPFQPIMETPVQLHQFAKVRLTLPALAVSLALPLPAPQAFLQHPTPQAIVIHHNPVFCGQVLGRERRPESLLLRTGIFFLD